MINKNIAFVEPIVLFAGNFEPYNCAFCKGQLLPISQFPDLYANLGSVSAEEDKTLFAVPDLREEEKRYGGVRFIISLSGFLDNLNFLGIIMPHSGDELPICWEFCEGQLININNQALFALIGTLYGGDGNTTFALPDLRSVAANTRFIISTKGPFPSRA